MSAATNIAVNFIAEYKNRQALKSAEKDMGSLSLATKKLGSVFLATFSVAAVTAFGKASVAAFAADEKSAKILANTLGNLGLAFSDVPVEAFITKLSELNGVAKTDLRNAFDTLVRSTGDASKAQDLLSLGLDVSAGTGKDLALVTTALAKGYAGNFAALSKLGAGITAAELKSKDFAAIQSHLASVFRGDASTAADTFSGKMARLKTTFEEFKITIGSGIVDALSGLAGSKGLTEFQASMDRSATDIADMIRGVGVLSLGFSGLKAPEWLTNLSLGGVAGLILGLVGGNKRKSAALDAGLANRPVPGSADIVAQAAAAKLLATQKAQLAAQKAITDQKAKQAALDRASLSLKLAGNTTDMQNIEIQAALQRGQSEQVTNVLLLQANILSQEVLKANGLVMDVNGNIGALAGAKDPFKDWPAASSAAMAQLKAIQDALATLKDKTVTVSINTVTSTNGVPTGSIQLPANQMTTTAAGTTGAGGLLLSSGGVAGVTDAQGNKFFAPAPGAPSISGIVDLPPTAVGTANNDLGTSGLGGAREGAPINVTVNLNGQTVGNAITNAQVDQSASGIPNSFARNYAGAW